MYSGSRRYRGVRYVTQYVPIDSSSGSSANIQSDKEVTITSNGTITVQPDSGYDAMSQVSITTNVPAITSSDYYVTRISGNTITNANWSTPSGVTLSVPKNNIILLITSDKQLYGYWNGTAGAEQVTYPENSEFYLLFQTSLYDQTSEEITITFGSASSNVGTFMMTADNNSASQQLNQIINFPEISFVVTPQ